MQQAIMSPVHQKGSRYVRPASYNLALSSLLKDISITCSLLPLHYPTREVLAEQEVVIYPTPRFTSVQDVTANHMALHITGCSPASVKLCVVASAKV